MCLSTSYSPIRNNSGIATIKNSRNERLNLPRVHPDGIFIVVIAVMDLAWLFLTAEEVYMQSVSYPILNSTLVYVSVTASQSKPHWNPPISHIPRKILLAKLWKYQDRGARVNLQKEPSRLISERESDSLWSLSLRLLNRNPWTQGALSKLQFSLREVPDPREDPQIPRRIPAKILLVAVERSHGGGIQARQKNSR